VPTNHWMEKAKANLLNASINKDSFEEAKKEWHVTSHVIDNFGDDADFSEIAPSCELCEHEDLRWQFQIINKINSNELLVGSTCIKQFDIPIINSDMSTLTGEERDKVLQKRIDDQKKENNYNELLQRLRDLWRKDKQNRKKIEFIAKKWKGDRKFDPKDGYFIRWRFMIFGMPLDTCRMEINLRTIKNKLQVVNMTEREVEILTEILTTSQKEVVLNIRKKGSSYYQ